MSTTVFCGNLPLDVREREVEDLFYKYGRVVEIDLKLPSRPPGFAFVEFSDTRDASDACRGRDGYEFGGQRLRVSCHHVLSCARCMHAINRAVHTCRPGVTAPDTLHAIEPWVTAACYADQHCCMRI